jgi:hypothetical protein
LYGCPFQHPPERLPPKDPSLKLCPTQIKFGFCNVGLNPLCMFRHTVSRIPMK